MYLDPSLLGSLTLTHILLLLGIGVLAGLIEATAGGSGLVTLPTLLMLGFQPVQALATSKFQYAFGAVVSITRFAHAGLIAWRDLWPLLLAALLGGAAGAWLLLLTEQKLVAALVPFFLIVIALYFAFNPTIGDQDRKQRLGIGATAIMIVPIIALYDGFFGTGSASFYMMACVTLLGMNVRRATATTKLVDFMSGGAALAILAGAGHVLLIPGLLLAAGQTVGAFVGAGLVLKHGAKWVRPVIVLVTIALSVDLLLKHHDYLLELIGLQHQAGTLLVQ
jgi:uncharacterized protein